MQSFLAGEAATIIVPLRRNGEPFVPDIGSVIWSLRGHDGAPVSGAQNVPIATDSSTVDVLVPTLPAHNQTTLRIEKRWIVVKGTRTGRPFSITTAYRLTPFFVTTASCATVRALLGLEMTELPDELIDIASAYLDVEAALTQPVLEAVLVEGGAREVSAHRAIALKAGLEALPALRVRLMEREDDGLVSLVRGKVDFEAWRASLQSLIGAALNIAGARSSDAGAPALFIVPEIPDPFDGV